MKNPVADKNPASASTASAPAGTGSAAAPTSASEPTAAEESDTEAASTAPASSFVEHYLPALLAQAHHLISSEFHRVARAHGFSVSEWRVMASLAGGGAVSIGQLAQVTILKQPTVTRMLDRMTLNGHVERLPHDSDRRVTLVRITAQGQRKVQHLTELAREHERRVLQPFGLAQAEALKATLRRMIALHARVSDERESGSDPAAMR